VPDAAAGACPIVITSPSPVPLVDEEDVDHEHLPVVNEGRGGDKDQGEQTG
jgi:hypothetical protein